jgi:hypothetical protein
MNMQSNRKIIAQSQNGIDVWFNTADSHAATHISDTPHLEKLASEVIGSTVVEGTYMQFHVDMGRVVGETDLVDNHPDDKLMYAKRLNRETYTVFNMTKSAQPSSLVTIALERKDDGTYELMSTWIGPSDSPSFPDTDRETPDSKSFWAKHSLAWGNQAIQKDTLTSVCPW